ncbi:MAG: LPS export ABC transporter periplasmic protein LptC [Pseudomonadota bacterium]
MTGVGYHVNWTPLGLALILAALGTWLNVVSRHTETVDNAGFTHDPDYLVENFDALAYDLQGNPQHRLTATRMTHYMDDDTTVLDQPGFQSLDTRARAEVHSRRALISADGKRVFFLDRVRVNHLPAGANTPITVETDYLQVTPEMRTLETDRSIILRQGTAQVGAGRLFIDGKAGTVSLSGQVRGTYAPAR